MRPSSLRAVIARVAPDDGPARAADPVAALGAILDLRQSVRLAERLSARPLAPARIDEVARERLAESVEARVRAVRARATAELAPAACEAAIARAAAGVADPARAAAARLESLAAGALARARADLAAIRDEVGEAARAAGGPWAEAERIDRALDEATRVALERRVARAVAAAASRLERALRAGEPAAPWIADAGVLAGALVDADARRLLALVATSARPESV